MSIVSTDTAIHSTADTTTFHESTLVQSFAESSGADGPPLETDCDTVEKVYIDFALYSKPKPARDPVDKGVNNKLALKQKELLYQLDQLRKK